MVGIRLVRVEAGVSHISANHNSVVIPTRALFRISWFL
jgi:hypothetical protein